MGIDVSNYTDPVSPAALDAWTQAGVRLVLIQAISPPTSFPLGKTRAQLESCAAAGIATDVYFYLWTNSDVAADMQAKLTLLAGLETSVRKVWLDVEDTSSTSVAARLSAICTALAVLDEWCADNGKPQAGIYTARWWWTGYVDDPTEFDERPLWAAQYDDVADASVFTPFGGWTSCRIKQWAGSRTLGGIGGIDMNVLSTAEVAELAGEPIPPADDPCAVLQLAHDALVTTVADIADRLGDLLLAEADHLQKPMRRWYVRSIVAQMQTERTQAIGPRPQA